MRHFHVDDVSAVSLFKRKLGAGVRCYVALYQEKPVAFIAVAHVRMKGHFFRVSRFVVLPDYQGIGIGRRLLNFVAKLYTSQLNLPFYLVTSNPQLVRGNLDGWIVKRVGHGRHGRTDQDKSGAHKVSKQGTAYCITEYAPKKLKVIIHGHDNV